MNVVFLVAASVFVFSFQIYHVECYIGGTRCVLCAMSPAINLDFHFAIIVALSVLLVGSVLPILYVTVSVQIRISLLSSFVDIL